jgi:hypothetical protein
MQKESDDAVLFLGPRLLFREIQINQWKETAGSRGQKREERTTPISLIRPSSPYQRDPAFVGFTNGLGQRDD